MEPASDKYQAPTNGLKLYVRDIIKSEARIKEETIAINRDSLAILCCTRLFFKWSLVFEEDKSLNIGSFCVLYFVLFSYLTSL